MDERCVADAQVVDVAAHDELVVDHALLVLAHLAALLLGKPLKFCQHGNEHGE